MAYAPTTDFLALLRQTSGGVRTERMPGLDYIVAALARMGLIALSTGQTPPTVNQQGTVWLRPSTPSWVAEGNVFLWNAADQAYEPATSALWPAVLGAGAFGYSFQSVGASSGTILPGTTLLAVQRTAPAATALALPGLAAQFLTGRELQVVDFSTNVTDHAITLTTPDSATIMQSNSWELRSSADQLAGVTLRASPDLNAWIIAP